MTQITHEFALENFYHQIDFAIKNYDSHGFKSSQFSNIIIAGLGGSGIGGRIAKAYFNDSSPIPIEVYSDYQLPAYASSKSLIILSSYSGLTEETLAMYEAAKDLGASLLCISSGGTLTEWAGRDGVKTYPVETGYQPRMALGFSLTYNLLIIGELLGKDVRTELEKCREIYADPSSVKNRALSMLDYFKEHLNDKYIIVADNKTEAIGVRFSQQIQENAKMEAFVNVLPEANHNAFETYYGKLPSNFIFINSTTNDRNNGRFAYLKQLLEKQGNMVYSVAMASSSLYELFSVIYLTDWFSIVLSNAKGADNMSVPNISGLKSFLLTFN